MRCEMTDRSSLLSVAACLGLAVAGPVACAPESPPSANASSELVRAAGLTLDIFDQADCRASSTEQVCYLRVGNESIAMSRTMLGGDVLRIRRQWKLSGEDAFRALRDSLISEIARRPESVACPVPSELAWRDRYWRFPTHSVGLTGHLDPLWDLTLYVVSITLGRPRRCR
jgi:hypothetical protein